jgi:hypothetical protein
LSGQLHRAITLALGEKTPILIRKLKLKGKNFKWRVMLQENLILSVFRDIQNATSEPEVQKHLQIFSTVDVLLTFFFVTVVNMEKFHPIFQTFLFH